MTTTNNDDEIQRAAMLSLLKHINQQQCDFVWGENIPAEHALSIAIDLVAANRWCMSDETVANVIDGMALMAIALTREPVSHATRERLQRIGSTVSDYLRARTQENDDEEVY